jgi:UDP-N-acetylglucosamine--N-acetylmuramyl-(pentapeptide) pyrophosphoryl-undecaprenol N-acetylglucosamine transferase
MSLVNKDAAVLVKDNEAKEILISEMHQLLYDDQKLKSLRENIKYFGRPQAAIKIAEEILKLCKSA